MARLRRALVVLVKLLACAPLLEAQRTLHELHDALVGQPLYLRGLWISNKLEFDPEGHLRNPSEPGPLTLSGVDVLGVTLQGKDLVIRGQRTALVANAEGRLERKPIYSTTILFGSLRRSPNDKFFAYQEMRLVVHPDASNGFDTALKKIFANGLAELAPSVPPYWRCYAEGYFARDLSAVEANSRVNACVDAKSLSHADPQRGEMDGFVPAKIIATVSPRYTAVAGELGVQGLSHVHFTVSDRGIPVGFQIVQAVGGGMDEETLRAVSNFQLQPAQRGEKPVPADLDFQLHYTFSNAPPPK